MSAENDSGLHHNAMTFGRRPGPRTPERVVPAPREVVARPGAPITGYEHSMRFGPGRTASPIRPAPVPSEAVAKTDPNKGENGSMYINPRPTRQPK